MTNYISDKCPFCSTVKITMDKHYKLPPCYNFIMMCPKHPKKLYFDLPISTMREIVDNEK